METEFWTRDEDIAGTRALFQTPLVENIRIDLVHGPAVPPDSSAGFPAGTLQIRILQTLLEVDEINGTTWLVEDPQDLFFRSGREDLGENPAHWSLIAWRDLPSAARAAGSPSGALTTWGGLKTLYRQRPAP